MISVATVLEELGLEAAASPTPTPEDARRDRILARMIASATATLGQALNRYLGPPELVTEYKRGGTRIIVLNDEPAIGETIAVPAVRTRTTATDPFEAVDAGDYALTGRTLRHGGYWPAGDQGVEVVYTRGYEVDEGPAELRELVLDMVTSKYAGTQAEAALKSEKIGDYSYTAFADAELAAATFGDWESFARRHRRQPV